MVNFWCLPVLGYRIVGFYVEQHNTVVPHLAFQGQTHDEMYFGTGAKVPSSVMSLGLDESVRQS